MTQLSSRLAFEPWRFHLREGFTCAFTCAFTFVLQLLGGEHQTSRLFSCSLLAWESHLLGGCMSDLSATCSVTLGDIAEFLIGLACEE